jgi:short chain dehydrogenase
LRNPSAIDAMMTAVAAWGGPDIVVNNAGIQRTVSLAEATQQVWDDIIAVNLSGAFHTMRRALPGMGQRGYGRVINIASVHGLVASVNKAPYVAAKFGLIGLSRVAALEYAANLEQYALSAICGLAERVRCSARGKVSPDRGPFDPWPAIAWSFARCHTDSTRDRTQAGAAAIRSSWTSRRML